MADHVVITTDHIETAVPLRDAFQRQGYAVELLTPTEKIGDVEAPVLLVLTGNLGEKRARRLAREAQEVEVRLPMIGIGDAVPTETVQRLGLAHSFVRPVDAEEVALVGHRLVERERLRAFTGIVGRTEAMEEVLERVTQIAPVHSTVLITGESGTGKELVARGIHGLSPRRNKPFIAANVAALPETLLESELFGHEKGAFTGASAQRKGFFELAHGGTLFLDEIGEMPQATQTKLLRVLEQREFMRVGGETPIRVDVRVLAATNRDLRQQVQLDRFRRDLYYRLNVLHIDLPPLRHRREDIPILVNTFVEETAEEHDLPRVVISPEAMELLRSYDWPGNVRELRNLVESMVVLAAGGVIGPEDIPEPVRSGGAREPQLPVHVPRMLEELEAGEGTTPALEFMFRLMLQLRMDVEDLRNEFESYRREHPELPGPLPMPYPYPYLGEGDRPREIPVTAPAVSVAGGEAPEEEEGAGEEEGVVVFRPGMSMRDLEREAITAALAEVDGNRRAAADMLGIGERTLYRKIKEYDIPL